MTIEKIVEELRERLRKRMTDNGYEQGEILVDFHVWEDGDMHASEKEFYVKNGITGTNPFGTHFDFKPLFSKIEGPKPKYFYIKGTPEQVNIYSNIPIPGMELTPGFEDPKQFIFERMNPFLEEGVEYINEVEVSTENGPWPSLFYAHKDGVKSNEVIKSLHLFSDEEFHFKLVIDELIKDFERDTIVNLVARKDRILEIRPCGPKELIAGVQSFYSAKEPFDKISLDVLITEELNRKGLPKLDFSGYTVLNGQQTELKSFPGTLFQYLSLALDPKPARFEVQIANRTMSFFADKAYPEYGIEAKSEDLSLSGDDLETICQFIESGRESKLKAAIAVIEQHPATKARLEKRYLNYVRACTENPDATLSDMTAELFSDDTRSIFDGHRPYVAKDFVSFGYYDEPESKRLIDFIGAMTRNYVNAAEYFEAFKESFEKGEETSEQNRIYEEFKARLKNGIGAEITLNPDGWYSRVYKQLMEVTVSRVQTDKSCFYRSQRMPFLKEYMLWLNFVSNWGSIHIDVFNTSEMHDLTEIYWTFKDIPDITWFQSEPAYPNYPFKEKRAARMRIDNGRWKAVKIDKK